MQLLGNKSSVSSRLLISTPPRRRDDRANDLEPGRVTRRSTFYVITSKYDGGSVATFARLYSLRGRSDGTTRGYTFYGCIYRGVFLPPGAKVCQVPDPIKNFTLALCCSINKLSCFENATRQAEKLTFSFSRLIQNARKKGILPERILRQRTQLAPSGVCAGSS